MPRPESESTDVAPQPQAAPTPAPGASDTDVGQTARLTTAAEFAAFLAPPQTPGELGQLGSFRVLKLIGAGGMGFIFEGQDLKLERHVALKVMRPEVAALPGAAERFLREAKTAAALTNDHIVTIYLVDESNGVPFLVMPLMLGESLHERLQRERVAIVEAIRLGRECAQGLAAAHAAGLVHRDIKPENLWLEAPEARLKILDFGLARPEHDTRLTSAGVIVGTPAYMAPEQAHARAVDCRADLFSLGCVLYELTTGQRPFTGDSHLATLIAVGSHEPAAPKRLNAEVTDELSKLILRMLAKDPAQRPTASEAAAALNAFAHAPAPERTRRDELAARVVDLSDSVPAFAGELKFALRYIDDDAGSSLTKSRLVLERLVFTIFTSTMAREPKMAFLKDMLADNQFTRKLERRILSRMNAIRDMANLGPHGEAVQPDDAEQVLENLCDVLEWHRQHPSVAPPPAPPLPKPPRSERKEGKKAAKSEPAVSTPPAPLEAPSAEPVSRLPRPQGYAVTFVGIQLLVLGILHLACLAIMLPESPWKTAEHPTVVILQSVLGVVGGMFAVPAAIGVLMRRNWGRKLCLLVAALTAAIGLSMFSQVAFFGALYLLYAGWLVRVMISRRNEFA
jgi:serine/threonine protein kinase